MTKINPYTNTKLQTDTHMKYIQHCAKGGSTPEFCLEMGISRKTFDNWCATHPHMQEAKEVGKTLAEGWWLRMAREHIVTVTEHKGDSVHFDTNLYKWITGGRFKHSGEAAIMEWVKQLLKATAEQQMQKVSTQLAEEAEYTIDDNNAKRPCALEAPTVPAV